MKALLRFKEWASKADILIENVEKLYENIPK